MSLPDACGGTISLTSPPNDKQDSLFIQFAREPVPGLVKTRMQPLLSAEQACVLHSELLWWTCQTLCEARMADVELWVCGCSSHPAFSRCEALGASAIHVQQGNDLGERMYHAIEHGLTRYKKVILVGSDCPQIDTQYLELALEALDSKPLVLGPATDGGYVLIGATRIQPALFKGVSWGEERVFTETVERMRALGEDWSELEPLSDIDRPEDLALWGQLPFA